MRRIGKIHKAITARFLKKGRTVRKAPMPNHKKYSFWAFSSQREKEESWLSALNAFCSIPFFALEDASRTNITKIASFTIRDMVGWIPCTQRKREDHNDDNSCMNVHLYRRRGIPPDGRQEQGNQVLFHISNTLKQ
jgi:hypothetical protein